MFRSEIYTKRREELHKLMKTGLAVFAGNTESPMNYTANAYHFRQDSDFLYFFGIDIPGLAGLMDFDSGKDYIFGNDFDLDDIIWMGPQPRIKELALKCGITETAPIARLDQVIKDNLSKRRRLHFQ
jgi:hypothetical protein